MHSRSFIMPYIGLLGDIDLPRCAPKRLLQAHVSHSDVFICERARKKSQRGVASACPTSHNAPYVAGCNHCTWTDDARASSLLRRVTGDLYIGGSSTGPAPVSPSHSVGPAMRRGATRLLRRCATRRPDLTACDIRAFGAPRAPRHGDYHHVAPRATPEEGNAACAMSPVAPTTVGQRNRPVPFAHLARPCFFAADSWFPLIPPPSPFLFLKISPARINGHDWDKCLLTPTHRRSSELRFALRNIQFRAD